MPGPLYVLIHGIHPLIKLCQLCQSFIQFRRSIIQFRRSIIQLCQSIIQFFQSIIQLCQSIIQLCQSIIQLCQSFIQLCQFQLVRFPNHSFTLSFMPNLCKSIYLILYPGWMYQRLFLCPQRRGRGRDGVRGGRLCDAQGH